MNKNKVYIAELESIIPQRYPARYIADKMYPSRLFGEKINHLAKKFAAKLGIENRSSVIDYEVFPKIQLADPNDHPRLWGKRIINSLTRNIDKKEIGLFILSYNISCHIDTLPNLASQIVMEADLQDLDKNEELAHYGCAAPIYSLQQAIDYCQRFDRPAIVFTFDQCNARCLQLPIDDLEFKKMLLSNLLFSDGGVGMLIIPERMRSSYNKPLMRIADCQTLFRPGNLITMKDGKFLTSGRLKEIMPGLVSELLMKPFLAQNHLTVQEIDEWSIHQGGTEIINQFCRKECLDLSEKHIERSVELFHHFGNNGASSCLLILESFFNAPSKTKRQGSKGIIVSFGAGYYLGTLLYEWDGGFT